MPAMNLVLFPEEFIRLNREVMHHPDLQKLLTYHKSEDFEIRLAEIAAYCSVLLDGTYDKFQQIELAGILERKLYNMRPVGIQLIVH